MLLAFLPLAKLRKKLVLLSPSFNQWILDYCLQLIASLKIMSWRSPFLLRLWITSSINSSVSCSFLSSKLISSNNIAFMWGIIQQTSVFQTLRRDLMERSFNWSFYAAHLVGQSHTTVFYVLLEIFMLEPHIFKFERDGTSFWMIWSIMMEKCLKQVWAGFLTWLLGKMSSHSWVTKNRSILLQEAFFLKLDNVGLRLVKGTSIERIWKSNRENVEFGSLFLWCHFCSKRRGFHQSHLRCTKAHL